MSADNGIFVLKTKGPEFRVAYAQNIDSIYGKFNDETLHWDGDKEAIRQMFAGSTVFEEEFNALDYANGLAYDYEYLEYGVCLIKDFENMEFPK